MHVAACSKRLVSNKPVQSIVSCVCTRIYIDMRTKKVKECVVTSEQIGRF